MPEDTKKSGRPSAQEIFISPNGRALLEVSGRMDRSDGKSIHEGWREVCEDFGWDQYDRTPAYEAYADGWYKGI